MNWAKQLVCPRTGARDRLSRIHNLSPAGAPWLVEYDLDPERGQRLLRSLPRRAWTMWRYRELLPVNDPDHRTDLGEGGTPLVPLEGEAALGRRVWVKQEAGNPTGSFKARGLSMALNRARELGAPGVRLPSAGNAAIAAAAYAAACGLPCRVAVPADTPPNVTERVRSYGARIDAVGETLVESGRWLAEEAPELLDVSTLREPYRLEGKKTMGFELAEQFGWNLPEWILYPTGGGTGLIGIPKAFDELERLALVGSRRPRMVTVQMTGCAPIVKAFHEGRESAEPWLEPDTRVWGLRVPRAVGDFLILRALRATGGTAVAVEEEVVTAATRELPRKTGLDWGPEGAACWVALECLIGGGEIGRDDRVVILQTGHPANYG
ncbi:MAG: threonine synthase [bacterium]|nr:threonine synthase [bacterium]